ncbi:hypothetical protein CP532_3040 [Ophiocordyceps camponoti-leonardi (nom. inval.)]|nr:hypothetical protein CP532_3040 [Ophiocordyceps camponoti-leonardi (nom. inval.)]
MRLQALTATLARALFVSHHALDSTPNRIDQRDSSDEPQGDTLPSESTKDFAYFYRGDPRQPSTVFHSGLDARPGDGDIRDLSSDSSWIDYLQDAFREGHDTGFVYVIDSKVLNETRNHPRRLSRDRIPGTAVVHAYHYDKRTARNDPIRIPNTNYRSKTKIPRLHHVKTVGDAPSISQVCGDPASQDDRTAEFCVRDTKSPLVKRWTPRMIAGLRQLAHSGLANWAEGAEPPCELPADFKFKTKDGSRRVKTMPFVSPVLGPKGNPQSEIGLFIMDLLNQRYDELDIEEACGAKSAREAEESKARAFKRAREIIEEAERKLKAEGG